MQIDMSASNQQINLHSGMSDGKKEGPKNNPSYMWVRRMSFENIISSLENNAAIKRP